MGNTVNTNDAKTVEKARYAGLIDDIHKRIMTTLIFTHCLI